MTCSNSTISSSKRALLALSALLLTAAGPDVARLRDAARAALDRGDGIAAEVPLRQAVRNGLPADEVRALVGEALLVEGDQREARKWLSEGSFSPGTEAFGWRARGRLEMAGGNLHGAAQAFDRALQYAPDDASLWVDIARLRFSGGEQAQAIEASVKAVQLDPRNARALELRGMLVREQYGLYAALLWFEAGLKARPDDRSLLGEYAATLGDMGQYRAMLVVCRKLAEVDPGNPRAYYLQAVLAARAGKVDLARSILLKTGTRLKDMPAAVLLNGVLEYRAGNANLAVAQFSRLLLMQPDNIQAQTLLARALARQGEHLHLLQAFDKVARQGWASPYLLQIVGQSWKAAGTAARGKPYLERAAALKAMPFAPIAPDLPLGALALRYDEAPNFASNAVPYVRGLLTAGQGAQALSVAVRLRDANPGASEAHLLSGDVRMVMGDARGALADYGAAAAIRFTEPVLRRLDATLRAVDRAGDADAMTARYLAQNPNSLTAMLLLSASDAKAGRPGSFRIPEVLRDRGL
jgi:tetratricopeptide (TPR) repeat protein